MLPSSGIRNGLNLGSSSLKHIKLLLVWVWSNFIATSHDRKPQMVGKSKGNGTPEFQGNPGWWNIIIWPDGWILGDTLDGRNLPPGFIYSARLPSTKGAPSRIFTQVKLTHILYIYTLYIYMYIWYFYISKNLYNYHWVYIGHFFLRFINNASMIFTRFFQAPAPKVPREGEEPVFSPVHHAMARAGNFSCLIGDECFQK